MTYLVFSDSHGDTEGMLDIASGERFDGILFLGDGTRDAETLSMAFPDKDICIVRGNNDWYADEAEQAVVTVGGVRMYLCHGHRAGVREGVSVLLHRAKENGCTVALFGHTHTAVCRREDGILLFNPGSVTFSRTYGVLTVRNGTASGEIRQRDSL